MSRQRAPTRRRGRYQGAHSRRRVEACQPPRPRRPDHGRHRARGRSLAPGRLSPLSEPRRPACRRRQALRRAAWRRRRPGAAAGVATGRVVEAGIRAWIGLSAAGALGSPARSRRPPSSATRAPTPGTIACAISARGSATTSRGWPNTVPRLTLDGGRSARLGVGTNASIRVAPPGRRARRGIGQVRRSRRAIARRRARVAAGRARQGGAPCAPGAAVIGTTPWPARRETRIAVVALASASALGSFDRAIVTVAGSSSPRLRDDGHGVRPAVGGSPSRCRWPSSACWPAASRIARAASACCWAG